MGSVAGPPGRPVVRSWGVARAVADPLRSARLVIALRMIVWANILAARWAYG
jgi:hypothetical protein